jgi:hypothetical protein
MSLKAFHIVFITASILLALGVGGWALRQYFLEHSQGELWLGLVSVAGGCALIIYEKTMLRRLKRIDLI